MLRAASGSFLSRLRGNRAARWSLAVIILIVLVAIVGPYLMKYPPNEQLAIVALKNAPPSLAHPFGTDAFSRDLLSRVVSGARISLSISAFAVLLSVTLGTAYGLVSGYAGRLVDTTMMRILDGCLAIPRVLLLIALATVWSEKPFWAVPVLLGATGWFGVSRLVRAETLAIRRATFIEAAEALGASATRTMWRHILPNVVAPVIVFATLAVGNVILLESGLSYLGAGTRPPTASWGALFNDGMGSPPSVWWVLLFPGLAILITVLAFNVLGDALRDILDPRQLHASHTPPDAAVATSASLEKNG
jgi:ABC-type dipeptide/oligopeptide/nickel transport system permease subunit